MIITISGQAGSGKSTVGKLLAEKLSYKHYSMGDLRRKMAEEKGISIAELNRLGEKEDFTDKEVDEYQRKLGEKEDNFVVDGRLSFHFIPKSVKIYLEARSEVRAQRVFSDERITEQYKGLEDAKKALEDREESDSKRYKKYYGIDFKHRGHFDIVLDTSDILAEKVVEKIVKLLKKR